MARLQFARLAAAAAAWAELAGVAYAGSLADIDHVVLFMQGKAYLETSLTSTQNLG